ncbi:MAG: hypothetical protein JSW00_09475 [Thermoplasmata archaeon]|nr:MAG: hypothetical protein JSW00_09475 [Thermoplasmata archaeon]
MRGNAYTKLKKHEGSLERLVNSDFMVEVQPDNPTNDALHIDGTSYGIFVLNNELRELIGLIGKVAAIRPISKKGLGDGVNVKK